MDRKNNHYAFEWFMRAEDERYWKMAQKLVSKKINKMTISIVGINVVISVITMAIWAAGTNNYQSKMNDLEKRIQLIINALKEFGLNWDSLYQRACQKQSS